MREEQFIGSFASGTIRRAGFGFPGLVLYATDKRLIGIKIRKLGLVEIRGTGAWLLGPAAYFADKEVAEIEGAKHIQELERKKEFEAKIDEISQILLTEPSFLRAGHLKIVMKSGPEIDIDIGDKKDFEPLRDLMEKFFPFGVKVQE